MRWLTGEKYKKTQMFLLPDEQALDQGLFKDREWDIDDFFLQEVLAKEDWYRQLTPEPLKSLIFDKKGQIVLQTLTPEIAAYCRRLHDLAAEDWREALRQAQSAKETVYNGGGAAIRRYLELDLSDGLILSVEGLDTREVKIMIAAGPELTAVYQLVFGGVRESWMGRLNYEDANWWLYDELLLNEDGRYELNVLFDNADRVGTLQLVFEELTVEAADFN